MVGTLIILGLLLAVAGGCKAVCDIIAHGKLEKSVFHNYADAEWWEYDSWDNKYKNEDPAQGPLFPGSTTWLVWLTDAWHCFGMIGFWILLGVGVTVGTLGLAKGVIVVPILALIYTSSFEMFYGHVFLLSFWKKIKSLINKIK